MRKVTEKTVSGKAAIRYGDGPVKVKVIQSDDFNSWEMFSILTSWLHAEATKVKQEQRIRGMKLVDFPKGEKQ